MHNIHKRQKTAIGIVSLNDSIHVVLFSFHTKTENIEISTKEKVLSNFKLGENAYMKLDT